MTAENSIDTCCPPSPPCLTADPDMQGLLEDLAAAQTQQEYDDIFDQLADEVQTEEGAAFVVVQMVYFLAHVVDNPGALLIFKALSELGLTDGAIACPLLPFVSSCDPRVRDTVASILCSLP